MPPTDRAYVVWEDDGAYVAQCLNVDVASDGDTEEYAVTNLREAVELHFDGTIRGERAIG